MVIFRTELLPMILDVVNDESIVVSFHEAEKI